MPIKNRFRLITRGERGRQFYCVDTTTGRRFSLKTRDRDAARQIVFAWNQSLRQLDAFCVLNNSLVAGGVRFGSFGDRHVAARDAAAACVVLT